MRVSAYAWCWSRSTEIMLGRVSAQKPVEDIVQSKAIVQLQPLAEELAAWSVGAIMGDV